MTQKDYLRFSHDKYLGRFEFNDFKIAAEKLEKIVKTSRNPVDSEVFICDSHTYTNIELSGSIEERKTALKQREQYPLSELDRTVWDKAYKLQLTLTLPQAKEPFMVCLDYNKNEKNRLFFYGQELDEKTYQDIMEQFHKRGLLYKLGNGFEKISELRFAGAISNLHKQLAISNLCDKTMDFL
jgi:hypothetical protein